MFFVEGFIEIAHVERDDEHRWMALTSLMPLSLVSDDMLEYVFGIARREKTTCSENPPPENLSRETQMGSKDCDLGPTYTTSDQLIAELESQVGSNDPHTIDDWLRLRRFVEFSLREFPQHELRIVAWGNHG